MRPVSRQLPVVCFGAWNRFSQADAMHGLLARTQHLPCLGGASCSFGAELVSRACTDMHSCARRLYEVWHSPAGCCCCCCCFVVVGRRGLWVIVLLLPACRLLTCVLWYITHADAQLCVPDMLVTVVVVWQHHQLHPNTCQLILTGSTQLAALTPSHAAIYPYSSPLAAPTAPVPQSYKTASRYRRGFGGYMQATWRSARDMYTAHTHYLAGFQGPGKKPCCWPQQAQQAYQEMRAALCSVPFANLT